MYSKTKTGIWYFDSGINSVITDWMTSCMYYLHQVSLHLKEGWLVWRDRGFEWLVFFLTVGWEFFSWYCDLKWPSVIGEYGVWWNNELMTLALNSVIIFYSVFGVLMNTEFVCEYGHWSLRLIFLSLVKTCFAISWHKPSCSKLRQCCCCLVRTPD